VNTGCIKGVKLIYGFITDSLALIIDQVKSYTENTLGILFDNLILYSCNVMIIIMTPIFLYGKSVSSSFFIVKQNDLLNVTKIVV